MTGFLSGAKWRERVRRLLEPATRQAEAAAQFEEAPRTAQVTFAVSEKAAEQLQRLTKGGLWGENAGDTARDLMLEKLREVSGG